MATAQRLLTAEQVSQYLIGNGLYLTGLEFLVEGQEIGGFDLTFLQSFFSDASRFPPEEVQRFQGEDVLSSMLMAKEREQKLCLAEYELRVATEDLKHTKDQRSVDLASHYDVTSPEAAELPTADPESYDRQERKHLNSVVMAYLMQCGYKVSALTFREEAFPEFEKRQPAGDTLAHYYHLTQESPNKSHSPLPNDPPNENGISDDSVQEIQASGWQEEDGQSESIEASRTERVPTPDVTSANEATLSRHKSDADACSEPRTPWNDTPTTKPSLPTPSSDLLSVLMEYLPKIVPNVLIKKRSDCIPVLVALVRDHPDMSSRSALLSMLFSLIKHPDDEQRQSIVQGVALLAECLGSERIAQEILPHCCELSNHKRVEKRLLVAEVMGVICQSVDDEIRSSLMLSLLQQLSTDVHETVRKAALMSLLSCLKTADIPSHKQRAVEQLMIDFVKDTEDSVSDLALSELVPLMKNNQGGLQLSIHFIQKLFGEIEGVLECVPYASQPETSPTTASTDQCRLPRNSQQKTILSLLDLCEELIPDVADLCCRCIPFWAVHNLKKSESEDPLTPHADKERNSLDPEDTDGRAVAFEKWLDETESVEENRELHVFIQAVLPSLISTIAAIAPVSECLKLRERLAALTRATCKAFEWCVVEGAMKPLFLSACGLDDLFPVSQLSSSNFLRRIITARQPNVKNRASVLPVYISAILSEGGNERFYRFMQTLMTPSAPNASSWAIENKKEFLSVVVFSGTVSSVYERLSSCLVSCSSSEEAYMRCGAALIAEALSIHAPYQDNFSLITPAVLQLAEDVELNVRLHAVSALQQISIIHASSLELMSRIYPTVEKIMATDKPQVKLAALGAFSSAASQCNVHAVFVLKQIPTFLDELRDAPSDSPAFHLQLTAAAVFESLLVLEGVEILDSSLRSQLVASIETLIHVAPYYLDNAQRQILSAMVSDQTSKLGQIKRRLKTFSMGGKRHSVSSDVSCASDPSRHGDS